MRLGHAGAEKRWTLANQTTASLCTYKALEENNMTVGLALALAAIWMGGVLICAALFPTRR